MRYTYNRDTIKTKVCEREDDLCLKKELQYLP